MIARRVEANTHTAEEYIIQSEKERNNVMKTVSAAAKDESGASK